MTDETVPKVEEDVEEAPLDSDNGNVKRKRTASGGSVEVADEETVKKAKSLNEEQQENEDNGDHQQSNEDAINQYSVPLAAAPQEVEGDSVIIEISPEKVGQVIGSKGAIIQEIQMRTGAKAFLNQDFPDGVNRQVNLTGTPEQVKAAHDLIRLILDQGPQAIHMNSTAGGPIITSIMECTQQQVGKVIGTQGATIKELQSKSGARIQIDQDFPPDVPRKINMTGTASAVAIAAQLIQQVITVGAAAAGLASGIGFGAGGGMGGGHGGGGMGGYGGGNRMGGGGGYGNGMYGGGGGMGQQPYGGAMGGGGGGMGGEQKLQMEVPKTIVGKIIGRGGETITSIQRKSGARVQVDQTVPEGMPCKIMMSGSPQALQMVHQLLAEVMVGAPGGVTVMPMAVPVGGGGGMPMGGAPHMMGGGGYGMPSPYGAPQQMPPQQYGAPAYGGYPMQQPQQQMYAPQQAYGMPPMQQGGYQAYGAAPMAAPVQQGYPAAYGQPQPVAAPKAVAAPAAVWTEHKTDDGITYWYNAGTGVSQWERPKSM